MAIDGTSIIEKDTEKQGGTHAVCILSLLDIKGYLYRTVRLTWGIATGKARLNPIARR